MSATLLVALLCAWGISFADEAAPPQIYTFNIPRSSLVSAIQQFSEQTGIQVTANFGSTELPDQPVEEILGELNASDALQRLLKGTKLHTKWEGDSTVHIYPRDQPHAGDGSTGVEVTGTRLTWGRDAPAPVRVYHRDDIDRLGASTLGGVARYFTQQPYSFGERSQRTGAQHLQMRGLGVDTTLVLVNGRRALPSATSATLDAFDLNAIPLTAVERIEILSDSASAIYGADAIGGVVNIELKESVESPELLFHYGAAEGGGEERRVAGAIGSAGERLSTLLAMDYFERGMLVGAERDLWTTQDFSRYGGNDFRVTTANPGNVYSLTNQPLPGLPTSSAAVPVGSTGVLTPGDFAATAGMSNLGDSIKTWSILPEARRSSAFASAEFSLNKSVSFFGELLATRSDVFFQSDVPSLTRQLVPAGNPFNPFDEDVVVDYSMLGMKPMASVTESDFARLAIGARGELSNWDWEVAFAGSEERVEIARINELDLEKVTMALASSEPETALNPFADGPGGSKSLLSSLVADSRLFDVYSGGLQVSGFLRGALFSLPGGRSELVVGGEWRQERSRFFDTISVDRRRDVSSGFVEWGLPVLSHLSIKLAWREDHYTHADNSGNPQYGLVWRPLQNWLVRAAYGTSFRAPSLPELYSPRREFTFPIPDPARGGSVSRVSFITGGNPDLVNISARSFTSGVVYRPGTSPGLHAGAHYWRVVMDNRVVIPRLSDIAALEDTVPTRITRAAPTATDISAGWPGAMTVFDTTLLNYGRLDTSGVDLDLAYRIESPRGRMEGSLLATWVNEYVSEELGSILPVDHVGIARLEGTIPRWRIVGALTWEGDGWGTSATATFTPRYHDSDVTGALDGTLPSRTIVDVQAWLALDRLFSPGLFGEMKLTAGALNVFNRKVDFANAGSVLGYDASMSELRQRFAYLRLTKDF